MNILAIDQARNGAWSVFAYETKKLIGHGTFSFDSKKYTYAKAIQHIEEIVATVIKAYDISAVFIEDIQLRANVQAFKRLAQLQGVLINHFEKNEYLYGFVVPTQWQKYCLPANKDIGVTEGTTIKPIKQKAIDFVRVKYGIETDNDNLADSICIGDYVVNVVEIKKSN